MTSTIWIRVFVASLVLLVDYAYSSEINDRFDVDDVASNNVIDASQSISADDDVDQWNPSQANYNTLLPCAGFPLQSVKAGIPPFPYTVLKYTPLNPRAPPVSTS